MPLNRDSASAAASAEPAARAAALGRRLAAMVYDALLLLALIVVFTILVMLLRGWREIEAGTVWFQLAVAALVVLFYGWFWTHGGQTLGMLAWKIELRRDDGAPFGWRDALLRCAAALVSLAPFGVGLLWSLFDRERLALHDRLTRTRIVAKRPAAPRRR